jgi:uncharacterized protein
MTIEEVQNIAEKGLFPGSKSRVSVLETHISFLILTEQYAFKIKKPVVFGFLDFSTIALRKRYCEEELQLNRRLTPDMYLSVLPVGPDGIGDASAPPVDYALQMRRLDNANEMHLLLQAGKVTPKDMEALAQQLVPFHQAHRLPPDFPYSTEVLICDFSDLFSLETTLESFQLPDFHLLQNWKIEIPAFLRQHEPRILARIRSGYWVEGHGDLHSRNIFLPPGCQPVIFDCLEFSRHLRCMDTLSELAFLCMDLDAHGHPFLGETFLQAYNKQRNCFETTEDVCLFQYFKAYRANIRLKVAALAYLQHEMLEQASLVRNYWRLFRQYMLDLPELHTSNKASV